MGRVFLLSVFILASLRDLSVSATNTAELKENGKVAADVIHKKKGESVTFECVIKTGVWSLTGIDSVDIEKRQDTMNFMKVNSKYSIRQPFLRTGRFSIATYEVTLVNRVFTAIVKMIISALKLEDFGTYRCALVRTENNVDTVRVKSPEITFIVLSAPASVILSSDLMSRDPNKTITEHVNNDVQFNWKVSEQVSITCQADGGYPKPELTVLRNGVETLKADLRHNDERYTGDVAGLKTPYSNAVVTVNNYVPRSDDKLIQCFAKVQGLDAVSTSAKVVLSGLPMVVTCPRKVLVTLGQKDLTVQCSVVTSDPLTAVTLTAGRFTNVACEQKGMGDYTRAGDGVFCRYEMNSWKPSTYTFHLKINNVHSGKLQKYDMTFTNSANQTVSTFTDIAKEKSPLAKYPQCSADADCQRFQVSNAVCRNVSASYILMGMEHSGYRMECRCTESSTCHTKGAVCEDVSTKNDMWMTGMTIMGSKPSCRCPSASLNFPLIQPPYCLRQGYTDWFQHSIPQLGFMSELIEKSPAVVESFLMTFLSIMKNGSKLCDWMSCGNRAAICSDISVFKKLMEEPKSNKMDMSDLQTLVCKVLSTNLTQLYMDLTRDTKMVKDLVKMMMNMDTITHAELETVADNIQWFVTHAVAFFSDPKPFEEKLGLKLPDPEAFVNMFNRVFLGEFSRVVIQGWGNLENNTLEEWLKSLGTCEQMRKFVSKAHDSLRHGMFMLNKVLEFTSSEDIIGTLKKFPQTKKLMDMMDKMPQIVAGFGELALVNPRQMQKMLDKVLDVLLSDSRGMCNDTSFLEGYVIIAGGTTVKNILDLFCHDLVYEALWRELGLHKLMDEVKMWFMTPSYAYVVRFDPPKFVDDIEKLIKMITPLVNIGKKRYREPVWVNGRLWETTMAKTMSYASGWTKLATITQNIQTYLDYLRLPIPNTLTAAQNIGFLSVHDVVILINELLKGLGGSLDYLSTVFANTVEMKKIIHLLTNDLPTVFEKAAGVLLDHVKLAKFTKALQDEDACDKSSNLHSVIGDNPLTQLMCELDAATLEAELARLADNDRMVKALYQLVFQKYDGQSFSESAFIDELRRSVDLSAPVRIVGAVIRAQSPLKPLFNSTVWERVIGNLNAKSRTSCSGTNHILDCFFRYIKASLPVIRWKMLKNMTSAIAAVAREVDTFMIDSVLQPLDDMIQGIREPCEKTERPSTTQPSTPEVPITTTEAKTTRMNASIKLGLTFKEIYKDLTNSQTKILMKDIKAALTALYQRTIKNFKEVIITDLRNGSVVVHHQVVLNTVLPTNKEPALQRNITQAVAEKGTLTIGSLKVSAQPSGVTCTKLGDYCRKKKKVPTATLR